MDTQTETRTINWREGLSALKTSAEFGQRSGVLRQALAVESANRAALDKEMDVATFSGGDIPTIHRKISDNNSEISAIEAAISGAETRRDEASKREHDAETQELLAANEAARPRLHTGYEKFKETVEKLREIAVEIDNEEVAIERRNAHLHSRNVPYAQTLNIATVRRVALGEPTPVHQGLSVMARRRDTFLKDLASLARQRVLMRHQPNAGPVEI